MKIPTTYIIGVSLMSVAGLRMLDIAFPVHLLPWWAYAMEWGIGFGLMVLGVGRYVQRC